MKRLIIKLCLLCSLIGVYSYATNHDPIGASVKIACQGGGNSSCTCGIKCTCLSDANGCSCVCPTS